MSHSLMSVFPIPVALISAGVYATPPHHKEVENQAFGVWTHTNLADYLKVDPMSAGVSHWENGSFPNTVARVYAQLGFLGAVTDVCGKVFQAVRDLDPPYTSGVGHTGWCTAGIHRAYVVEESVAEVLNSLKVPGTDRRLFTALHFATSECKGKHGISHMMVKANTWVRSNPDDHRDVQGPWLPIEETETVSTDIKTMYGYKGCKTDGAAYNSLQQVHDFLVDGCMQLLQEHLPTVPMLKAVFKLGTASGSVIEPVVDASGGPSASSKRQWDTATPDWDTATPTEPHHKRGRWNDVCDEAEAAGWSPAYVEGAPSWASFEFNAESWWRVLESYNVDQSAQQLLFLLASYPGDQGKKEANRLIRALIYGCYNDKIRDPSAYMQTATTAALKIITNDNSEFQFLTKDKGGGKGGKGKNGSKGGKGKKGGKNKKPAWDEDAW